MIKRILLLTIFSAFNLLIAQKDPVVVSGGYSKIYKGKEASFEKAVANHVAKWHGPNQWATFAAKVMTGPRTGPY